MNHNRKTIQNSKMQAKFVLLLVFVLAGITILNWKVQGVSLPAVQPSAQAMPGDDPTDSLEQGWGICEELVDMGFCFQDNPTNPGIDTSCYAGNIGEVAPSADVARFGSVSLRTWANKADSLKSNHVIAQKRVSNTGYDGTRRYELQVYIDPATADSGETGPEFSMQNTREVCNQHR